jgi:hypothetical protein
MAAFCWTWEQGCGWVIAASNSKKEFKDHEVFKWLERNLDWGSHMLLRAG